MHVHRIRRCISHTLGPILHARYLHSWNRVGAEKADVGNISSRAFRRRVAQYGHPLGCRTIELGKPPQGGVTYTVVYGTLASYSEMTKRQSKSIYVSFKHNKYVVTTAV